MRHIPLTPKQFERYPSLFQPQQTREWLASLPATATGDTLTYEDRSGRSQIWCAEALVYASARIKRLSYTDHSQYVRRNYGVPCGKKIVNNIVDNYYAGSIIDSSGKRVDLQDLNPAYQVCIANVIRGPNLKWSSEYAAHVVPLATPDGGVAFPFFGGFCYRGCDLTELTAIDFPLKIAHEEDGQRTALPVYRHGGRSIIVPADTHILLKELDSGGLELPSEVVSEGPGLKKIPVAAFQYVGAGQHNYIRHFWPVEGPLRPGDAYLHIGQGEQEKSITRRHYWGLSGVFLDQRHQTEGTAPTGGMIGCEDVVNMEKRLLAQGAHIGAITIGYLNLISKDKLKTITGDVSEIPFEGHLQIQVKAITDSTVRIHSLIPKKLEGVIGGENGASDFLIRRIYFNSLSSVANSYFGDETNAVEMYLRKLGTTMGANFRAAIHCGLTIPWNDNSASNLSLTGALCDVENFVPCTAPYNFTSMALRWIDICVSISKIPENMGSKPINLILHEFFKAALADNAFDMKEFLDQYEASEPLSLCDNDEERCLALKLSAAAFITGKVVSEIYAKQQPTFKPQPSTINDVFGNFSREGLYLNYSGDIGRQLLQADEPKEWAEIAPIYYSVLAALAIGAVVVNNKEPVITWF